MTLPDGRKTEARFRVFQWPLEEAPAGMRIFACEHLTRDAVWIPGLQRHANGATGIVRIEIVSAEPDRDAAHMARLLDQRTEREPDGAVRVASGESRGAFVFLTSDVLAERYPAVPRDGMPSDGAASLVLATSDVEAAARALGPSGIRRGQAVYAPPARANGVLLAFEQR